jgi:molecular chaperone GrpE
MSEKKPRIEIATREDVSRYAPGQATEGPPSETGESSATQTRPTPDGETGAQQETLDGLRGQVEEYKDKMLRAQAECANIAKRLTQQHAESLKLAGMDLARSLLSVVDNFERTLESLSRSATKEAVSQGVKLIADQLMKTLADHGIQPIDTIGKPFDPRRHEAVMEDRQADLPPGNVSQEFQRGYMMHDRVLRPAKVAVAGPGQDHAAAEATGSGPSPVTPQASGGNQGD